MFLLALILLLEKGLEEPIQIDLSVAQRISVTVIEGNQVPGMTVVITGGAGDTSTGGVRRGPRVAYLLG